MNDPIHNFTLRYHCIGGGHGVNRLDRRNSVYAHRGRFNRVYRDFLCTVQKEKEVLTRPLSFHANFASPIMGKPKLYLEVFDMKTILGVTTGLLVGVALGIAGVTALCISDDHFMKFFAENCGYRYEESEEDEAK